MSIKSRLKILEAIKKATPKNNEMMEALEKMFSLNPKGTKKEIEALKKIECSDETRELILFAIQYQDDENDGLVKPIDFSNGLDKALKNIQKINI